MTPILFKILQGSLFLAFYLLIFQLIFSRFNAFKWHRVSLLVLPLLVFAFPFLLNNISSSSSAHFVFNLAPVLVTSGKISPIVNNAVSVFSLANLLLFAWFFIAFCLLLRLLLKVNRLLKNFPPVAYRTEDNIFIHYDDKSKNAWTFFNHIIVSDQLSAEELEIIIMHEMAHAKQHHSIDVLFTEIIQCLLWWHPFIYLWKKNIKENHEYLADAVVTQNIETNKYCELIVNQSFDTKKFQLTNTFFYNKSNLIKRIVMMKKNQKFGKYVTVIGALGVFLVFVGFTYQQNGIQRSSNQVKQQPLAKSSKIQSPPDSVYEYVKHMPKYPGGRQKMYDFLSTNTHYPASALKDSIQGKSFVTFIVMKDGNLSDIKIKKGSREDFNKEAIRVVRSMPKWIPGRKNGKKVNVRVILPFYFTLPAK